MFVESKQIKDMLRKFKLFWAAYLCDYVDTKCAVESGIAEASVSSSKLATAENSQKDQRLQSTHMHPENLTMLSLHGTKIKSDPMPILEKLQYLSHLELLSKSYMGKEMVCSAVGFPSLVNLELTSLNIEDWIVEQGAMPNLVCLKICNCRRLKMIPQGLKYVSGLQQVKIENMPNSLYDKILTGHD
ncbi:hypothetical protein Ancab_025653 [Ancistrocladus abbreviatus]